MIPLDPNHLHDDGCVMYQSDKHGEINLLEDPHFCPQCIMKIREGGIFYWEGL